MDETSATGRTKTRRSPARTDAGDDDLALRERGLGGRSQRIGSPGGSGSRSGPDARLTELEHRMVELERRGTASARRMVAMMMPEEVRVHVKAAGREQLLAVRAMLDFWIDRLVPSDRDGDGDSARGRRREEIEIE